jgi:Protein of unknown function (DUF3108)
VGSPGFQELLSEMRLRKLKLLTVHLGWVFLLSGLATSPAFGQTASLKVAPKPFEPGEELVYKAEISRALLRKLDVATFKFTANKTPVDQKTNITDDPAASVDPTPYAFKFTGDVSSEGFFIKLFNIHFRQHVESIVDPQSLAVQKTIKFDEQGKRVRSSETIFDRKACKIIWTERDPNNPTRPLRTASSDLSGPVQDVLSGIYYVRTQELRVGQSFEVPISDSGRIYHVPVRVVEKKRMKTVLGRVPVVLVDVQLFGERGMVNTKGQFSIWLTDDQRHIPVSAALKTEYGTFDITLKKVSHQASQQALLTKQ